MIHHYFIHECGLSPEETAVKLKGWEILPIMDDDVLVGEAILKGSEIHVVFARQWRGKGLFKKRKKVKAFMDRLLKERGFLVTKSVKGSPTERFIRGMGFKQTHSDKQFNYWWLV